MIIMITQLQHCARRSFLLCLQFVTLPSERKIQVTKDLVLDVIMPGLESLRRKPDKSRIYIRKTSIFQL